MIQIRKNSLVYILSLTHAMGNPTKSDALCCPSGSSKAPEHTLKHRNEWWFKLLLHTLPTQQKFLIRVIKVTVTVTPAHDPAAVLKVFALCTVAVVASNWSFSALKWAFRPLIEVLDQTCSSLCCSKSWRSFLNCSITWSLSSLTELHIYQWHIRKGGVLRVPPKPEECNQ